MGRPSGSAHDIELRRRRALALLDEGKSLHEVGRMVGCSASSVMHWRNARTREGDQGLKARISTGRPRRINDADRARLESILHAGATACGHPTNGWTMARIAEIIHREFGVTYHEDYISRFMQKLGWSYDSPGGWAPTRLEEQE
jgi:transposase